MFESLVARLRDAGARDEALGVYEPARRMLGVIPRAARIRPSDRVWRLGDYLLTPDGGLLRVGRVIHVIRTDRRRSIIAVAATEHHELALAARRGGFTEGATVNFGAHALDPSIEPASLTDYLEDRAELLIRASRGDATRS